MSSVPKHDDIDLAKERVMHPLHPHATKDARADSLGNTHDKLLGPKDLRSMDSHEAEDDSLLPPLKDGERAGKKGKGKSKARQAKVSELEEADGVHMSSKKRTMGSGTETNKSSRKRLKGTDVREQGPEPEDKRAEEDNVMPSKQTLRTSKKRSREAGCNEPLHDNAVARTVRKPKRLKTELPELPANDSLGDENIPVLESMEAKPANKGKPKEPLV